MSVIGPQKRLTQYTGVENTTTTGSPFRNDDATVARCSSASGGPPAPLHRESTAAFGAPCLDEMVRFSVCRARSPGAGTPWWSRTRNAPLAVSVPRPLTSAVTSTSQNPGRSKVTSAAYTPRPFDAGTATGASGIRPDLEPG